MTAKLDHTIVYSRDKRTAAVFLAEILDLPAPTPIEPFLAAKTDNGVTLDFMDQSTGVAPAHYAFRRPQPGHHYPSVCHWRRGMRTLQNRVALVTGSSRGIGAAIARLFADHGAAVAIHGRDRAAICTVAHGIVQGGGKALQVAADVTDFAEIEAMRHLIEKELGPVHIQVANAGREKLAGERPALKTPAARGPCASGLLRIHEMACD